MRVGESERVRLPGRGTAGYEWVVQVSQEQDETVSVREVASDEAVEIAPPGVSRDHIFVIASQRPGRAMVRFEQRRPWERESAPIDVRQIEVIVEP